MNKKVIWGIVLGVVAVIVGVFALKTVAFVTCYSDQVYDNCYTDNFPYFSKKSKLNYIPVLKQGIIIEKPNSNQEVQMPITVKGYINGNGWSAFEGVAGSVQVFDANNKAISDRVPLTATTDWMQPTVHFETTVGDRQMMSNLSTQTGVLVFKNENTKGDPENDKEFRLPIKFVTLSNTQSSCTDKEFAKNITKNLPNDVEPIVYRVIVCNHFGGEDGYSQDRIDQINQASEEYKCSTIEKDQRDLLNKYSGDQSIINAIQSANSWDESSCQ